MAPDFLCVTFVERKLDTGCLGVMAIPYTILFVEDDAAVRESAVRLLASMGFRLLVARDGYEALRMIAQHHADVLFTDIVMPGRDGIELAKLAKQVQPDLKILFMTGYYSRAREAERLGKLVFKPARLAEIEAELSDLLGAE